MKSPPDAKNRLVPFLPCEASAGEAFLASSSEKLRASRSGGQRRRRRWTFLRNSTLKRRLPRCKSKVGWRLRFRSFSFERERAPTASLVFSLVFTEASPPKCENCGAKNGEEKDGQVRVSNGLFGKGERRRISCGSASGSGTKVLSAAYPLRLAESFSQEMRTLWQVVLLRGSLSAQRLATTQTHL